MSNHMWGTFGSAVFAKFGTLCQFFFKLYNTKSYISTNYMEYRSSGYLRPIFRSSFFAPKRRWEEESCWCIIENLERACGATKSSLRSYVAPNPDWSGHSHLSPGVTTKEYSKNYKQIVTTKIIRTIKKNPRKPLPLVPSNWQKGDSNWHGFEATTFSTERRDGPSSPLYNHTANRRIACYNYERFGFYHCFFPYWPHPA